MLISQRVCPLRVTWPHSRRCPSPLKAALWHEWGRRSVMALLSMGVEWQPCGHVCEEQKGQRRLALILPLSQLENSPLHSGPRPVESHVRVLIEKWINLKEIKYLWWWYFCGAYSWLTKWCFVRLCLLKFVCPINILKDTIVFFAVVPCRVNTVNH